MTARYGCSTFCCMNLPLREALPFVREKTDRIEIVSEGLHDLFRYHEDCQSVSAHYTVHAPLSDINLASTNERIRAASLAVIDDLCGICDSIHATVLVVHPGYFPWENMRAVSRESLVRSLDDLCAVQQEHDVRIGIENMGSWECLHFRQPDLVPELASRDIGFVLDVGHARLNNALETFAETSVPCHIHFHDNKGTNDDHAACGAGSIDFARILPHLPDNASRVIEVSDIASYEQSVAYLTGLEQHAKQNPA
jgi:sugar phosphate isomerase/epimerase